MSGKNSEQANVVIVGGGPGGSTLAALVAMQGHRVIVLEKEKFPRHQIGESLLPSTVHGVFRLTGVSDDLEKAGFIIKRGGTYRWGANKDPWTFAFAVSPKMASKTSYAYQVERMKLDTILLNHARKLGADVRENSPVTGIIRDNDRVRGVYYTDADGNPREILATYVVDASGNQSRIYKNVGSRKYSDFFRGIALYGYFEGGKRLPPPNSGNILSAAFDSGWFWYIPLRENLTSVGAVVRREEAGRIQGDPEKMLMSLIDDCPMIKDYLKNAKRITTGDYGRIRTRKDYSYYNTAFWCPGMVLVGDAACFVDPVFSTGVHLSTYSALLAARSINSVLAGIIDEPAAFQEFELRYRREYSAFYEYLMCFYNMNVDEDSYFWSAKKVTNSTSSDLEAFVELVGGVASGEAALAQADVLMQRFQGRFKEYVNAIDELVANDEQSMLPLFRVSVIQDATEAGNQIQATAMMPGADDLQRESPLFENGLISSVDGMFWSRA
jgi:halogenation protein CepH